ncbi:MULTISPECIES: imidazoleglycerol-phosphate dehydratase HisB [unclassified Carboxydocella]|uniref:imidazoleglycerol-phosphate dehydratase HisB n=1 Tax=unclassified Carboxydocella TaxID=2685367 RepID=UPI0009ABBC6B|nr:MULTISPECIES: imidazoleglycerol-phosphate dehydratase HisB [unclassified Carboxydocella]GAW29118.1 hypothetical protein ULO1_16880 [Carboxydocella sp. ULO1]GAW31996.1 hypothetical protein JDF658_17610 [Carboxydocella sp. JDF658]
MNRTIAVERTTRETRVKVVLELDQIRPPRIETGIGFFDHLLTQIGQHGLFGLTVEASGDLQIDAHHTVEDVGITLGQALVRALGDKAGINRFGEATVPLDDALVQVVVDLSGRPYLNFDLTFPRAQVGNFDLELVEEFCRALVNHGGLNLHVRGLAGHNCHHLAEACFKALGRALGQATMVNPRIPGVLSSKGVL